MTNPQNQGHQICSFCERGKKGQGRIIGEVLWKYEVAERCGCVNVVSNGGGFPAGLCFIDFRINQFRPLWEWPKGLVMLWGYVQATADKETS